MQCKSRLFRNSDGKFKFLTYNSVAAVDYSDYKFDTRNNIANLQINRTSFEDIITSVEIKYNLDRGAGSYRDTSYLYAKKDFSRTYLNEALDATEFAVTLTMVQNLRLMTIS